MLEWRLLFWDYQRLNHIDKNLLHVRNLKILANIRSLVYYFYRTMGTLLFSLYAISLHHYLKFRIYFHSLAENLPVRFNYWYCEGKACLLLFPWCKNWYNFSVIKMLLICFSVSDYHMFPYVIHGINRPLSKTLIVTFLYLWLKLTQTLIQEYRAAYIFHFPLKPEYDILKNKCLWYNWHITLILVSGIQHYDLIFLYNVKESQ